MESGRLPEGSHLGGKRRQGLVSAWEKYEGKNKGSQERNGSCWGRCWHPAGAQGGLQRTRRRRGLRDAQPRGGRGGLGRGVGGPAGGAAAAHQGRRPQERPRAAHAGPAAAAAPAPPRAPVTFPLPRLPPARPRLGPEDAAGFARCGPRACASRPAPAAGSRAEEPTPQPPRGPRGVEGSPAPPLVPACLRMTRAEHRRSFPCLRLPGPPLASGDPDRNRFLLRSLSAVLLEARCGHISSPRELVFLSDSRLAQAYTLHSYGWGTGICVFNMQGISGMLCILICELLFQVLKEMFIDHPPHPRSLPKAPTDGTPPPFPFSKARQSRVSLDFFFFFCKTFFY